MTVRPPEENKHGKRKGFKVSAILIGSVSGWGLGIKDSVRALIDGAQQANKLLEQMDGVRIDGLELLELYEDRAIQALQTVRELQSLGFTESVEIDPILRPGTGGRCRASSENADGWWQRVKIEELHDGSLKFSTATGLARIEEQIHATQRTLVHQLINQAISKSDISEKEMASIYNLITPNALKDRASDRGDLLLMLDPKAAGYPWEMMYVGDGEKRQPLALRAGLIRQLALKEYREHPKYSNELRALIVADPDLPTNKSFSRLPGALREGESVGKTLNEQQNIDVVKCLGSTSQDIMTSLFDKEYRILHLAGHGAYRWPKERHLKNCKTTTDYTTGMIIDWTDDDEPIFLTDVEVGQMSHVPELVFINCCHLGINPESNSLQNQNRFAGDLATSFIKMGVRAVIAAGWAVDDNAAEKFAITFYDQMLGGNSFGEAVRAARNKASEVSSGNTWAAYQCYGDPSYRLQENNIQEHNKVYLSPNEVICDIQAIGIQLRDDWSGAPVDSGYLMRKLEHISASIPHEWYTQKGAIRSALGDAYGAHGEFDRAIEHYLASTRCSDSQCSLKAIEQLFNLRIRHAVTSASTQKEKEEAIHNIEEEINKFEQLVALIDENNERCCLLGSAYKRLSTLYKQIGDDTKSSSIREKMIAWYQKGMMLSPTDPYPAINWATGKVVQHFTGVTVDIKELETIIEQAKSNASEQNKQNPRFWESIHIIDAELLLLLTQLPGLGESESNKLADKIIKGYSKQFDERGTVNTINSVNYQFELYFIFIENKAVRRIIRRIKRMLGK